MSLPKITSVLFVLLIAFVLPACTFSTASDVTPPPGSQVEAADTAVAMAPSGTSAAPAPTQTVGPGAEASLPPSQAQATAAEPVSNLGETSVVFSGHVSNLSGSAVPAELQVDLQGFEGMENILTQSTSLNQDASFEFEPVQPVEGQVFVITVEYNQVVFASSVIEASALSDGGVYPVDINIYDSATDLNGVYADRAHIFFNFLSAEQLQVVVYLLVSNPTNLVVAAPDGEPVLTFSLPPDASNLQFEDSGMTTRFIPLDGGFGDLLSIRPGSQQHEILYSFDLPYDRKRDLAFIFPIDVQGGTLIIPQTLTVEGGELVDAGEREMDTGLVHLYNLDALPAGQTLEFELSGKMDGAAASSSTPALAIGLGIFAVVLLAAGFWLWRKSSMGAPIPAPGAEAAGEVAVAPAARQPQTEDALLDAIIDLDQEYEDGSISEEEYSSRRNQIKEKLKALRNR